MNKFTCLVSSYHFWPVVAAILLHEIIGPSETGGNKNGMLIFPPKIARFAGGDLDNFDSVEKVVPKSRNKRCKIWYASFSPSKIFYPLS